MIDSYTTFIYKKKQITMCAERKIIEYSIDEKTYKSLYIQFQREYIQSIVLSKLLEELEKK